MSLEEPGCALWFARNSSLSLELVDASCYVLNENKPWYGYMGITTLSYCIKAAVPEDKLLNDLIATYAYGYSYMSPLGSLHNGHIHGPYDLSTFSSDDFVEIPVQEACSVFLAQDTELFNYYSEESKALFFEEGNTLPYTKEDRLWIERNVEEQILEADKVFVIHPETPKDEFLLGSLISFTEVVVIKGNMLYVITHSGD